MKNLILRRSDIVLVNLEPTIGHEQGKTRPCLIIQNNMDNLMSPVTIIAPITSKLKDKQYPTDIFATSLETGLDRPSTILLNQIKCVDKSRIHKIIGKLVDYKMTQVNEGLKVALDLTD